MIDDNNSTSFGPSGDYVIQDGEENAFLFLLHDFSDFGDFGGKFRLCTLLPAHTYYSPSSKIFSYYLILLWSVQSVVGVNYSYQALNCKHNIKSHK